MCGIFGYLSNKDVLSNCLKGIKYLEYRGYDSAGIAGIINKKIILFKQKGNVSVLQERLKDKKFNFSVGIAHTRWATHGPVNDVNAHPHVDMHMSLALVHNGIIENHEEIRSFLEEKKYAFFSDTDSEVIVNLISYYYKDDMLEAINKTIKKLKGSFAIACIHKDFPSTIFASSRESPLSIGYTENKNKILVSSDANAFLGEKLFVHYLNNDEIALINKNDIAIYNGKKKIINKPMKMLDSSYEKPNKNSFDHFMLKEIHEQPISIENTIFQGCFQRGPSLFPYLKSCEAFFKKVTNVIIIGAGSAWHAGKYMEFFLEEKLQINVKIEIASEFCFRNFYISKDTLIIAISQSGETADTIAAVKKAKLKKAKILSICNFKDSTLARESDMFIPLYSGPEFSVCATKTFTSQLTVVFLFTLYLSDIKKMDMGNKHLLNEIIQLPKKIEIIINDIEKIKLLSNKYSKYKNFFFIGRKYSYITALEASLKLKEITYLNTQCYPAGELKHGPIALLDKNYLVIAFCAGEKTYDKLINNLREVKTRNVPILSFANKKDKILENISEDVFYTPKIIDELSIISDSVVAQLFAYFIAKKKKMVIDQPRNLAKSVSVE